jgi:hypothetical protein
MCHCLLFPLDFFPLTSASAGATLAPVGGVLGDSMDCPSRKNLSLPAAA